MHDAELKESEQYDLHSPRKPRNTNLELENTHSSLKSNQQMILFIEPLGGDSQKKLGSENSGN